MNAAATWMNGGISSPFERTADENDDRRNRSEVVPIGIDDEANLRVARVAPVLSLYYWCVSGAKAYPPVPYHSRDVVHDATIYAAVVVLENSCDQRNSSWRGRILCIAAGLEEELRANGRGCDGTRGHQRWHLGRCQCGT